VVRPVPPPLFLWGFVHGFQRYLANFFMFIDR